MMKVARQSANLIVREVCRVSCAVYRSVEFLQNEHSMKDQQVRLSGEHVTRSHPPAAGGPSANNSTKQASGTGHETHPSHRLAPVMIYTLSP